jgi:hypothetical protein
VHARDGSLPTDEPSYRGPERRTRATSPDEVEPVVLTRKLAEVINGIDLSESQVGDRLPVNPWEARVLIAEGWAEPTPPDERRQTNGNS